MLMYTAWVVKSTNTFNVPQVPIYTIAPFNYFIHSADCLVSHIRRQN